MFYVLFCLNKALSLKKYTNNPDSLIIEENICRLSILLHYIFVNGVFI